MTREQLTAQIAELAGCQRRDSFIAAAEFILDCRHPFMVETGCYRGIPQDGQSTVIFALLARETGGCFFSFDLSTDSIARASELLRQHDLHSWCRFVAGDSMLNLVWPGLNDVDFAYLDSFDYQEENPMPSQHHQLCEMSILRPKMAGHSAILLDDCDLPFSGKAGLSAPLILEYGWREVYTAYQRLFVRP